MCFLGVGEVGEEKSERVRMDEFGGNLREVVKRGGGEKLVVFVISDDQARSGRLKFIEGGRERFLHRQAHPLDLIQTTPHFTSLTLISCRANTPSQNP